MKKTFFIILLIAGSIPVLLSQITISGTIFDKSTGEYLISANVYNTETHDGTVSNVYGFYSLKTEKGAISIKISYVGYQTREFSFTSTKDTLLNIPLEASIEIEEVIVSDRSPQAKVQDVQMSTIKLSPKKVKQLPVILGETDIIKTIQLTPGVQGGTEGSSGFFVRGGSADQNLILLDGVPVYNANHLFGFMSVFNSDAIKDVTLFKGGFPARYGGRLSSVLDIRMKEGNMNNFHVSGSIGIISSNLTLEGPIIKGKTSFMVSGRRSYFDIFTYPFQILFNNSNEDEKIWFGYFLQDFNAKINHKFSDKSKLYLSFYTGKDKFFSNNEYSYSDSYNTYSSYDLYSFDSKEKMGLQWGNFTGALRWNYIINSELFSNLTVTVNNYKFKFSEDWNSTDYTNDTITYKDDYYYETYSKIRDYAVKYDVDFIPNPNHYIRFGLSNTLHYFSPGVTVIQDDEGYGETGIDTTYGNINIPANEFYVYGEDEINIGNKIKINAGLHFSLFSVQGKSYCSIEPRVSALYLINNNMSVKASYAKMQQYLHLLANSSLGLPTDLWVPATKNISPQNSIQYAAGFNYSYKNLIEFSIEAYYKTMDDLVDYKEGSSFFDLNEGDWENKVSSGTGESYGVEILIQKSTGKTTGWMSYTYSRSLRNFTEVSYGKTYPYKYDAPHDFSIVLTHKFNDKWDVGVTWVFRSGYPFTLEDKKFISPDYFTDSNDESVDEYDFEQSFETRNSYRMPNYHRLDIGINKHKIKKRTERIAGIGAYNAYCRMNPMFIYPTTEYDYDTNETETRIKQISILPIIPYLRWSIKF